MAEDRRDFLTAGMVPSGLVLPGGIEGRERMIRITSERIRHIADRRPDQLIFCLTHLGAVLGGPDCIGHRPSHPRIILFVKHVGRDRTPLLVAVKFLDALSESWIVTAYPVSDAELTRRLRNGTMRLTGEP